MSTCFSYMSGEQERAQQEEDHELETATYLVAPVSVGHFFWFRCDIPLAPRCCALFCWLARPGREPRRMRAQRMFHIRRSAIWRSTILADK